MTSYGWLATAMIAIIGICITYINMNKQTDETSDFESHPYVILTDFISSSDAKQLRQHFEQLIFPAAKIDFSSSYVYTDIGEAYDTNSKGECYKPGTVLNTYINKCVFLPRLDAIRHFHLTGGYEGYKEGQDKLRTRTGLFINHQFHAWNQTQYAKYKQLFEAKLFTDSIRSICPKDYPFIKPIELNLVIQLPGQGLLAHTDAVYFKDATRQTHPLWLLSVMKESQLFKKTNIPQIQGVLYIGKNNQKGGELYAYPNGLKENVVLIPPTEKSVVIMDGTEIIHGTTTYNMDIEPLVWFPINGTYFLQFDNSLNKWRMYYDQQPTNYLYSWDDIRASMPYRALCFDDENEMNLWDEQKMKSDLQIDQILEIFKLDLIKRNKVDEKQWNSMDRYNLGKFLINQYTHLPRSHSAWIKWNYAGVLEFYCNNRELYNGVMHNVFQKMICSDKSYAMFFKRN